jgi:hypothetical protein
MLFVYIIVFHVPCNYDIAHLHTVQSVTHPTPNRENRLNLETVLVTIYCSLGSELLA